MKSNIEIARAFAAGATRGYAANLFIENETIYSYGHHFPVAKKLKDGIYLFNVSRYSNSTSKHQSDTAGALSQQGAKLIRVFAMDKADNDRAAKANLSALKYKVATARRPELYEGEFASICSAAKNLDKVLKTKTERTFNVKYETFVKSARALREEIAKQRKQQREQEKRIRQEQIELFEKGGICRIDTGLQLVRFSNNKVITSKGIILDITDELKEQAKNLLINDFAAGEKIGVYRVKKTSKNRIEIGCHTFSKEYLTEKINDLLAM